MTAGLGDDRAPQSCSQLDNQGLVAVGALGSFWDDLDVVNGAQPVSDGVNFQTGVDVRRPPLMVDLTNVATCPPTVQVAIQTRVEDALVRSMRVRRRARVAA